MALPQLPPAYRLTLTEADDVFAAAERMAAAGADGGQVLWRDDPRRLECAVILAPDRPLDRTRLATVAALSALADALAALAPPNRPIGFAPGRLLFDGACVGKLRFAHAAADEQSVPEWACLGLSVDILGDPADDAPGRRPEVSSLREEGFGEVAAATVLEGFTRHFLAWLDRWETEGDAALTTAWRRRLVSETAS